MATIDFEGIKESLDLRKVAREYGLNPNKSGFVCCPFHIEKTPSMKVEKGQWYCFGCHQYGDVYDFIGKMNNLNFVQTLSKMNEDYKLGLGDYIGEEEREQIRTEYRMRTADRALRAKQKSRYREAERRYVDEFYTLSRRYMEASTEERKRIFFRLRFLNSLLDAGLNGNEGIVLYFEAVEKSGLRGEDYCEQHGIDLP